MEDKIINYIKENFYKYTALMAGIFLLILLFAALDNFFEKIISDIKVRGYIYLGIILLWSFFWLYKRYGFPKNKKDNVGIIICIRTENDKQKIRLKNDFVRRINESIAQNNLASVINVILLNNYQADLLAGILYNYSKKIEEIRKSGIAPEKVSQDVRKWLKAQKKINGHFFVWGNVKERQDEENKYFFDLEALVIHNPINIALQKEIANDFLTVWYKKISFQEKIEFKGFILTADLVYIAIKYIIGIAALFSGDPFLAINLHANLEGDFSKFNPLPPNLQKIKNKLSNIIAEENLIIARRHYFNNNLVEAKKYIDESFKYLKENYSGYLLKAIIDFVIDKNPDEALKSIRSAKQYSENDGTWRYSEGFLLMYLEKFDEALKIYKKILENTYPNEDITLKEIFTFNENFLKAFPDKIQSYFIIGYLKYKKELNYPEALRNFEIFLDKSKNDQKLKVLSERAMSYKAELEQKMKLRN